MVGEYDGLGGFVLLIVSPVGLQKDCIDLLEIDGFGAVPHGFYHGADTKVFNGSEGAFGAAENEIGCFFGEGSVKVR